jgi:mannosyltransferase OCH1-like enzyme
MIPRIIHQIHLGKNKFSDEQIKWQKTWIDYNPGWQYILWNDELLKDLHIQNLQQFNNCKNFSEKSDILRFEILYMFGGLYIDTDFECLKNIDPLFETYKNKTLIIFTETKNQIGSAFIAATKNNIQIKKLIDIIPLRESTHYRTSSETKYGPRYISDVLGLHLAIPDGEGSIDKTVYPYIWTEKNRIKEDFKKTHPEAYAVHHWLHSWKSR